MNNVTREEYLKLQENTREISKKLDSLLREVRDGEEAARQSCISLFKVWEEAQKEAVTKWRNEHTEMIGRVELLRREVIEAGDQLDRAHYQCNHTDTNGISTLVIDCTCGYDADDYGIDYPEPLRCTVCNKKWRGK